jgi:hypothetical protein
VLFKCSKLNYETALAKTELNNRTIPEQCLQKPVTKKQLLKAPEQESGIIVQQWQKSLFERNTVVKSHAQDSPGTTTRQTATVTRRTNGTLESESAAHLGLMQKHI